MSRKKVEKELEQSDSQLILWIGFLLSPISWSISLETLYLFSDYGCASLNFIPNHIVSAAALLLSLSGGAVAWNNWQLSGSEWPNDAGSSLARSRFMSALGLLSSALFSALIFAQWLPTILGVPCGK